MGAIKLKHTSGNGTILNSPAANPSSDITLKLPSTTGSAGQVLSVASANHSSTNAELEFAAASGGIEMQDSWRLTTNTTGDFLLSANLERADTFSQGLIGSAMSVTSGIFTFPATGFYMVEIHTMTSIYDAFNRYVETFIYATTDGTNYNEAARGVGGVGDSNSNSYSGSHAYFSFDVTDTSTHKVYFNQSVSNNSTITHGHSDRNYTYMMFRKLANT